jgi:hypothetical protein
MLRLCDRRVLRRWCQWLHCLLGWFLRGEHRSSELLQLCDGDVFGVGCQRLHELRDGEVPAGDGRKRLHELCSGSVLWSHRRELGLNVLVVLDGHLLASGIVYVHGLRGRAVPIVHRPGCLRELCCGYLLGGQRGRLHALHDGHLPIKHRSDRMRDLRCELLLGCGCVCMHDLRWRNFRGELWGERLCHVLGGDLCAASFDDMYELRCGHHLGELGCDSMHDMP